jgi:hypothetical protein
MKRAAAMITTAMIPHNEEVFTVILNFSDWRSTANSYKEARNYLN